MEEHCLPERVYCLPMGLTRDEVLQSQIGLRQCVCVCVCESLHVRVFESSGSIIMRTKCQSP